MSIREKATYLPQCDYPDCQIWYHFWERTKEAAIKDIIDDKEWLCLFTDDNEPRFFCPAHLQYDMRILPTIVLYDSDRPATHPTLQALNRYYEDMSTPQPLVHAKCEDTILAILQDENWEEHHGDERE